MGGAKAREVVRKGALKHHELNRKAEEGSVKLDSA
jgi:hypothetical protein